jgi:hypothetical protein
MEMGHLMTDSPVASAAGPGPLPLLRAEAEAALAAGPVEEAVAQGGEVREAFLDHPLAAAAGTAPFRYRISLVSA